MSVDGDYIFDSSIDALSGSVGRAEAWALAPRTCVRIALVVVSGCALLVAGRGNPYVIALAMLGSALSFVGSAELEAIVFADRSPPEPI